MATALIGIGSNLGEPAAHIAHAIDLLSNLPGLQGLTVSDVVLSRPIGGPEGQACYQNAVARIEIDRSAGEILSCLQGIELSMGRVRGTRWSARLIDLDLLLLDDSVHCTADLWLPHPWMCVRSFVLRPAADVAPRMVHPLLKQDLASLWRCLGNPSGIVVLRDLKAGGRGDLVMVGDEACRETQFERLPRPPAGQARSGTESSFDWFAVHPPDTGMVQFPSDVLLCRERRQYRHTTNTTDSVRAYLVLVEAGHAPRIGDADKDLAEMWPGQPAPVAWLPASDDSAAVRQIHVALQAITSLDDVEA